MQMYSLRPAMWKLAEECKHLGNVLLVSTHCSRAGIRNDPWAFPVISWLLWCEPTHSSRTLKHSIFRFARYVLALNNVRPSFVTKSRQYSVENRCFKFDLTFVLCSISFLTSQRKILVWFELSKYFGYLHGLTSTGEPTPLSWWGEVAE